MRNVRFYHDAQEPAGTDPRLEGARASDPCRLNLLLSYAGMHDNPWVERLPMLLQPMGVRSLRAGTGAEATEVIRHTPVHIAVVDLGLPMEAACNSKTEGGPRILELLRRLDAPPPIVAVKARRSHRDDARQLTAALRAGVFAIVDRPHGPGDLELMLKILQRCLQRFYQDRWPGAVNP